MYLGIDLGTSGVKLLLLNGAQTVVATADAAVPQHRPQPTWSEQHPADWMAAVEAAVAQTTADSANQLATKAGSQAQHANGLAQGAAQHVDQINTTVAGLDQYCQVNDMEVPFRSGTPTLSKAAKDQLDELASKLDGHQGYIIEMEAHSPLAGAAGIQSSQRLAESVQRYLVTEHNIPVYRMHFVAMGNAKVASPDSDEPQRVRKSTVHIRLMENSLAAQDSNAPHAMASATGAERP